MHAHGGDLMELAASAVRGEDWAVAGLMVALWPTVTAVCRRSVEADAASDAAQDSMERILRSLGQFRGDGSIEGWARQVTRSVCVDHLRRRQRTARLVERLEREEVVAVGGDGLRSTVGVEQLLRGLADEQRQAFAATQLGGRSYADVAVELGCPIGTIRSRVARARRELRRQVSPD